MTFRQNKCAPRFYVNIVKYWKDNDRLLRRREVVRSKVTTINMPPRFKLRFIRNGETDMDPTNIVGMKPLPVIATAVQLVEDGNKLSILKNPLLSLVG